MENFCVDLAGEKRNKSFWLIRHVNHFLKPLAIWYKVKPSLSHLIVVMNFIEFCEKWLAGSYEKSKSNPIKAQHVQLI